MNATLQWLVVGLLLAWSATVMLARFFPGPAAALRERLAARAEARGQVRLAAYLRPAAASGGCDSGCSSCATGCGTPATPLPAKDSATPVQWRH